MRLRPSPQLKKLIDKYQPLPTDQLHEVVAHYVKHRDQPSATKIIKAISRIFSKAISRNQAKFIAAFGPEVTYDDIFNQMTVAIFKFIDRFDPTQSKFDTWVNNALFPIIKQPLKVMGKHMGAKFGNVNKGNMVDINKPIGTSEGGATIGDLISDGDKSIQDKLQDEIQHDKLMKAISKLKPQDQKVIRVLFEFDPPPEGWYKKLKDGSISVNAATIARGKNIEPGMMRGLIAKMMRQLRDELIQQKFDKYFALDRLIQMYSGRKKFNKSYLLNKKDWQMM